MDAQVVDHEKLPALGKHYPWAALALQAPGHVDAQVVDHEKLQVLRKHFSQAAQAFWAPGRGVVRALDHEKLQVLGRWCSIQQHCVAEEQILSPHEDAQVADH